MSKVYFISGHRNMSQEDFEKYYVPEIDKALISEDSKFVIGDYYGVDTMAQTYLAKKLTDHTRVTVYHMGDSPMNLVSDKFKLSPGYSDDIARDSAMTRASNVDIAFIYAGRWTSGTAQNILRRYEI